MKQSLKTFSAVVLLFLSATGYSQRVRTTLFTQMPANLHCTSAMLETIFNTAKGQQINISFQENVLLGGFVKNNSMVSGTNAQSVLIILPGLNNSCFSMTRIQNADRTYSYRGRIINDAASDAFELNRGSNGDFSLDKIQLEKILPSCK